MNKDKTTSLENITRRGKVYARLFQDSAHKLKRLKEGTPEFRDELLFCLAVAKEAEGALNILESAKLQVYMGSVYNQFAAVN